MRVYGIKRLVVETAGSSGGGEPRSHEGRNQGILEGLANADEVRDLILSRVRRSQSAGLGDEGDVLPRRSVAAIPLAWRPWRLALLREIRDEARRLRELRR